MRRSKHWKCIMLVGVTLTVRYCLPCHLGLRPGEKMAAWSLLLWVVVNPTNEIWMAVNCRRINHNLHWQTWKHSWTDKLLKWWMQVRTQIGRIIVWRREMIQRWMLLILVKVLSLLLVMRFMCKIKDKKFVMFYFTIFIRTMSIIIIMLTWYYRPTGVENLAGAGVAKIGMPGPGVFNFLINISIWSYFLLFMGILRAY